MPIETLINKLNYVKQTNHSTWIACCPAHDDKNPSLGIRQVDDGRILVHCFAGCSAFEVLDSLDLSFTDLHPTSNLGSTFKPLRKIFDTHTALQLLQFESILVLEYARTINRDERITDQDFERLSRAVERIQRVCEAGGLI